MRQQLELEARARRRAPATDMVPAPPAPVPPPVAIYVTPWQPHVAHSTHVAAMAILEREQLRVAAVTHAVAGLNLSDLTGYVESDEAPVAPATRVAGDLYASDALHHLHIGIEALAVAARAAAAPAEAAFVLELL